MDLCLDLGLNNTGYSIFLGGLVIEVGLIQSAKRKRIPGQITIDQALMADEIAQGLKSLFKTHPLITNVYAELSQGAKSSSALGMMSIAKGVAIGVCRAHGLPIRWVSPKEVKQYSVGDPEATKKKIMEWARKKVAGVWAPEAAKDFEHIADSIAVWYAYKKLHGEALCEKKGQSVRPVPPRKRGRREGK